MSEVENLGGDSSGDVNDVERESSSASADSGLPTAFRVLLSGEAFSLLGTQITLVMVPLVAVFSLHSGEFTMGTLSAVGWAPVILFGLVAGAVVDRLNTWQVMLVCNAFRFVVLALIPLLALVNRLSIGALVVIAFSAGIANVFFDISYQTFVPEVVERSQLDVANSRLELCRSSAQLAGPLIGGALASQFDPAYVVSVDSLSFLIAMVTLLVLPLGYRRSRPHSTDGASTRPTLLREVKTGLRVVWSNVDLRLVVLSGGLINLFFAGIDALLVLYVTRALGFGSVVIGAAMACGGAGAISGALCYRFLSTRLGEGGCVRLGLACMASGGLVLPLAGSGRLPLLCVMAAQALFGYGSPVLNIALVTLRQKITPSAVLGRVNASARVAIMSSLPLGALVLGTLAQAVGMQSALWFAAIGQVVVVLAVGPGLGRITTP